MSVATYCRLCGLDKIFLDDDGVCEECRWEQELARLDEAAQNGQGKPSDDQSSEDESSTTSTSRRLGALSRSDSLALIAACPPSWRVKGILSTEDYGVLAGPKGVGKTFAMIDLAVAVALGEPWFGWYSTEPSVVLVLTSEDSRSRLWRRADAVARWLGHDPDGLEGRLFIHPFAFSAAADLPRFIGELEATRPGLVLLDPAYRYMVGVRAQLFDMGGVLTPLQEACSVAGAALLVGHHYNRREGAQREERISGAGLLEWARVVITVEAKPRRDNGPVIATFEITGNAIDPVTFVVDRRVHRLTTDVTGKGGLKQATIRQALNRDLEGQVDAAGPPADRRWWRV